MVPSAMGLCALPATSETAFTTARLIGAAYLIWMGIKTFRSDASSLTYFPQPSRIPAARLKTCFPPPAAFASNTK